jgi:hypothetical protein
MTAPALKRSNRAAPPNFSSSKGLIPSNMGLVRKTCVTMSLLSIKMSQLEHSSQP